MKAVIATLGILAFATCFGQTSKEKAVLKVVDQLFDAMREADSSKVRAQFLPNARMANTWMKDGKPVHKLGSLDRFCEAVGTPHDEEWNEVLSDTLVQIDEGLAHVWAPYTFHLGSKKLHSGVNSFQLVHTSEGWKILNLTDSRRK